MMVKEIRMSTPGEAEIDFELPPKERPPRAWKVKRREARLSAIAKLLAVAVVAAGYVAFANAG